MPRTTVPRGPCQRHLTHTHTHTLRTQTHADTDTDTHGRTETAHPANPALSASCGEQRPRARLLGARKPAARCAGTPRAAAPTPGTAGIKSEIACAMLTSGASSGSVTLTAQKALSSEPPTPTGVSPRHRLHPACWRLHGRGTAHCLGPRAQRSGTGREAGPDAQRPQLGRAGSGQRGACPCLHAVCRVRC